jgi:GAF domain-containing protein
VTTGRTIHGKTKRREGKAPRRNSPRTARQAGGSPADLKKKNALLTRQLNHALAQHKAASKRETATSRELSESLEREKATSQVLGIVSSSPTDLEPVFETILANAARLCEASYGTLWLCEGDAFRAAALHGAWPAAYTAERRRGAFRPHPDGPLARAARARQTVQVADMHEEQAYLDRVQLRLLRLNSVTSGHSSPCRCSRTTKRLA